MAGEEREKGLTSQEGYGRALAGEIPRGCGDGVYNPVEVASWIAFFEQFTSSAERQGGLQSSSCPPKKTLKVFVDLGQ